MSTSLSQKKKIDIFTKKVEIAIPPENPVIKGHLTVDYKVKSKPEFNELADRGLTDEEYVGEIVVAIRGLGHPETDEELQGEAALAEATTGQLSAYLVQALVEAYFVQYGEARRGNLRKRR